MPRIISEHIATQLALSANAATMALVLSIGLATASESGYAAELGQILSELTASLADAISNAVDEPTRQKLMAALQLVQERTLG